MIQSDDTCRLCARAVVPRKNHRFGRFDLSRCLSCGFEQIAPAPSLQELEELYGALYFQKAKYTDPKAIELEYKRRHKLMARAGFKSGDRLLEIGCGAGQFIATCVDEYDWHGMDFSPEGIEDALARLPQLSVDRLNAAPIEDYTPDLAGGLFDGVVIFDTVEHVYDVQVMLARAATWLKPGGKMIVTTPDIGACFARLLGRRWPFMTPPEHLSFFTRSAMAAALARVGLKTIYSRSLGKFANVAFVIYKAGRVGLLPKSFGTLAAKIGLGKVTIYVPTGDVMYVIAEKKAG
jgi:2-polyprenyl-3-methyl-5-hydroxy-6-metoxy-1,4-benzoquinol methylase